MTTYYVSKTGDNTDGRTLLTAKQTIAGGIGLISNPGDLLLINDGTYVEQINDTIPSGSSGSPVTLQAINRNAVIVQPTTGVAGQGVIRIHGRSWITLDGIDADAGQSPTLGSPYELFDNGNGRCSHIILQHGTARNGQGEYGSGINADWDDSMVSNMDIIANGLNTAGFAHGIYSRGQRNVAENNRIVGGTLSGDGISFRNNGGVGTGVGIVRNNIITDQTYAGIRALYFDAPNDLLVYNNIVHGTFEGISTYNARAGKFYNNTVYDTSGWGFGFAIDTGSLATTFEVKNNILYQSTTAITLFHAITGITCTTNLNVGGNGVSDSISETLGSTDPLFSNSAASDFHLQPGSPAIRTGTVLLRIPTDFDGYARNSSAYDIGAHSVPTGTLIAPWIVTT